MKSKNLRFTKLYSPSEAAAIAGTSASNVRRWHQGYTDKTGRMAPVFGQKGKERLRLSFMELSELIVAVGFRREGVKLATIRRAHAYAAKALGIEFPFASLDLRTHGGHILHEFEKGEGVHGGLVLDLDGQLTLPGFVESRVVAFDFDESDSLAYRWFPHGRDVPIVIDPRFGSGVPTIAGRNLRVDVVVARYRSGQPIDSLVGDFQLEGATVRSILRHAA